MVNQLRRCPRCSSVRIDWIETSTTIAVYEQTEQGIHPDGLLEPGDPVRVDGRCCACGHEWRARILHAGQLNGWRDRR